MECRIHGWLTIIFHCDSSFESKCLSIQEQIKQQLSWASAIAFSNRAESDKLKASRMLFTPGSGQLPQLSKPKEAG
jgi:hypothetical protein